MTVLHYASYFYYHCEQEGSYRMQLCQILTADWRSKFFAAMSTAVIGDDAPAHLACSEGTKTSLTTRNPGP